MRQQEVSAFCLSATTPVLPPEEVRSHTHETAHFVPVLAGLYVSKARYPCYRGRSVSDLQPAGDHTSRSFSYFERTLPH